ncbi:MAG: hypothetical protein Q7J27_11180, partial [Syntrophales bacterium]|nr:hypothetical protein [Syntrophales bacterium]
TRMKENRTGLYGIGPVGYFTLKSRQVCELRMLFEELCCYSCIRYKFFTLISNIHLRLFLIGF